MNMLKLWGYAALLAILAIAATSCDTTDNNKPELELIPVNQVTVDGYTISLEAEKEPETGANTLYWKLEQNGNIITPQSISIQPMMDMGDMMHSAPYNQPKTAEEDDRYFKNMAVFIMPSGSMGSWTINFEITTPTDEMISGEIPVEVASSWKLTSVRDDNDKVYFITWYAPQKPVTGQNDLTFLIHTRESMMNFPAVEDLVLDVYPYMDMGGGSGHSTDFTNPVATGDGFYEGDINYSMSGTWTTSVVLVAANDTLPEVVFEYSVQAQ
ncbi:FixH family protein [Gracilimonas mengyeensis]|uniref:YtkA-like n=1 Tax=Gracilimonas mengyeensis TaxID=1302730 RepID=A0A521DV93_9BACT|nr:FixH family protein [Gracilimonas mengyeensis]SMO75643.1 YtkA-like [Gracilimonas mengyeensis]